MFQKISLWRALWLLGSHSPFSFIASNGLRFTILVQDSDVEQWGNDKVVSTIKAMSYQLPDTSGIFLFSWPENEGVNSILLFFATFGKGQVTRVGDGDDSIATAKAAATAEVLDYFDSGHISLEWDDMIRYSIAALYLNRQRKGIDLRTGHMPQPEDFEAGRHYLHLFDQGNTDCPCSDPYCWGLAMRVLVADEARMEKKLGRE